MRLDRAVLMTATLMQAAPVLGGIAARARFTGPRLWVAIWCFVSLLLDWVMGLAKPGNNLWVIYLVGPLMGSAALYAMAQWQRNYVARITIWLMIPVALAAWALAMFSVEDAESFSLVVEPMYSLLCLGAALFTLGQRGLHEDAPLLRQDWFWLCGGLALYYGKSAVSSPVYAALIQSHPELVTRALTLMAATDIVAYLLLLTGILCRPTPSGASSSPSPSPWASSWSPSERLS